MCKGFQQSFVCGAGKAPVFPVRPSYVGKSSYNRVLLTATGEVLVCVPSAGVSADGAALVVVRFAGGSTRVDLELRRKSWDLPSAAVDLLRLWVLCITVGQAGLRRRLGNWP